jgi:hypothetical protein
VTQVSRTPARPTVFVQQLHRAAAQRGRLDPVYQDLSDHWTMVLQRLYPVWALIGPGLSDPGHIEIHSRTVYLDSESLLGPRAAIAVGQLERRAILCCFGVALHETLHAKHTKRWAIEHDTALSESDDPADRQLAVDRRLLEEPRMEAHGVREFPPGSLRGRFVRRALQTAVTDVILPAFAEQLISAAIAGLPVTRDLAARASVYLQARTRYGIIEPATLDPLRAVWRAVLGEHDLVALDDLYAKVIWIPDGELDRLDEAARAYRRIVGEPDPPPCAGGAGDPERSGEGGGAAGSGEGDGPGDGGGTAAGSLADALEQAIATARAGQLEQLDEDVDLQQVLDSAACRTEPGRMLGRGSGTGLPSGRLPDRGVDRPPYPDEVQHARRYANRLRQAITRGTRLIDKRTPGGRFDGRAYARGRAQQDAGRPVTTHPWRVTRQVSAPIEEPHVGLIIDTSGSMGGYEYALGPIAWILTDGLRQIGGRCATALFGNSAALLSDGTRDMGEPRTVIYDGQRRLLAAQASAELAGADGYEGLASVQSLIVLLLDHAPGADEIRRIQAQANQRESLSLVDQQEQLRDCWDARAGLPEPDRIAAVCADLGISPKRAHNLRRQLALPDPIRSRVAERPAGEQISVTMANRLADMHEIAPQLTVAVANRITSTDLHDKALQDLGAFVHRTVVEDEHTYAVRIDDGAMLDAAEQIAHAREHLGTKKQRQIAAILGCEPDRLDHELDTLTARAKSRALKIRITGEVRDRARNGRYAFVHDRGHDFAAGIWVVDPAFILDLAHQQLKDDGDKAPAREGAYFAGARLDDDELRDAAAEDEQRRAQARARHADATRSNLGLGHDIRAGLIQPSEAQLDALRQIVCRLVVRHYGELIAYGAGWTDPERQQPVGDTGRHEPHQIGARGLLDRRAAIIAVVRFPQLGGRNRPRRYSANGSRLHEPS